MRQRLAKREVPAAAAAEVNTPTSVPQAQLTAVPSTQEIYDLICEAAYYRAEKRGFTPGLEAEDWLQAEAEVLERVRSRQL